jgi:hypothetical protein
VLRDRAAYGDFKHPIPAQAGIGLRFPHLVDIETTKPSIYGLEIHSENLFSLAPAIARRLDALRDQYWLSLHGVGLSLGSADGLDAEHLRRLVAVVDRYQPVMVSEHLCWNRAENITLPDLLPLPLTRETLGIVAANVDAAQTALRRPIAVENISAYLQYEYDEMDEAEFLSQVVRRTGCKLLVDLNNLHVNALNFGVAPQRFLNGVPAHAVAEYHLAGPSEVGGAWIDTHATPVPEPVWALYAQAVATLGAAPTIIEWDQDLPPLATLVDEAQRAQAVLLAYANAA